MNIGWDNHCHIINGFRDTYLIMNFNNTRTNFGAMVRLRPCDLVTWSYRYQSLGLRLHTSTHPRLHLVWALCVRPSFLVVFRSIYTVSLGSCIMLKFWCMIQCYLIWYFLEFHLCFQFSNVLMFLTGLYSYTQ